jgi:hypothetical protein
MSESTILNTVFDNNDFNENYDPSKNTSVCFLTIYEKTQIFGLRKEQLSGGAQTTLEDDEIPENATIDKLVELEFKYNKIPFIVKRTFNNGESEFWKVEDLLDLND